MEEIKKYKNDLAKLDDSLLVASESLAKANEKFVKVNKELAAVNKELVRVNEQIKDHYIKQKEFISVASHELRTPTQSILGYVELLLMEPQSMSDYGEPIMRNALRLQKVISDILYISKIDNNMTSLNNERFNLTETMLQVAEDTKKQIIRDKKNVNIIYDAMNPKMSDKDIFVDGDRERIAQVISNILENAVKFVDEGTVAIRVDANNSVNNSKGNPGDGLKEVIVNIKDSGKGIDPVLLPRLFSKFKSKDGTGGTGLGLYICKNIVEAHGGRIWAKNNEDGKGATFSFSLPVRQH